VSAFGGTAATHAPIGRETDQHGLHGSKHLIQRQVSDHSFRLMVRLRRV
jgi:hypothetical protein